MSARIPARRLGQSVFALRPPPARQIPSIPLANVFQRHASTDNKDDNAADPHLENPVLEDLLRKKEAERIAQEKEREKKQAPAMRQGTMSKTSIFSQAREMPGWRPNMSPEESRELSRQIEIKRKSSERRQKRELSAMTLDPDRQARRRLERKLVLAGVKRRGRLTKAQAIARTERQNLFKSKVIPTSIKKLQKVVNQIAGKTVSEALVQLRFSKKKVARDVIKGLEQAHDEAITSRGMGLGQSRSALGHWQAQRANADAGMSNDSWNHSTQLEASSSSKNGQASKTLSKNKAVSIELKDGTRKVIKDPTEIYIDQAWIGPGETLKDQEFRARGKVNMIRHRTSTFSVLLKEEKTRVRLSEEIKKKRANRKLWNPLPDRPVTSQRQYCLW